MTDMRGAALLLVMWLILLLSGMVAGFAMAARIESMQGNGLARGAAARPGHNRARWRGVVALARRQ